MEKNSIDDPLFKQFVPLLEEELQNEGFVCDPVQDTTFRKAPKLLHKYEGRALLIPSSACAMHCRYCFRKNFPYETSCKSLSKELSLIAEDPSLKEIILSGGDPLSLSHEDLKEIIVSLSNIQHIKRIRFHTRFPIGIPERIDDNFLSLLSSTTKQIFFTIHSNHPKELDSDIFAALKKISYLGIPILNQTVLLKGVNNCPLLLEELFTNLSDHGIVPYYLHHLDKVTGTSHFAIPLEEGKKIMRTLSKRLSGYSLPKYVQEIPGAPSKTPIWY
jgi:EF-P beta-lysylation protein EpmB